MKRELSTGTYKTIIVTTFVVSQLKWLFELYGLASCHPGHNMLPTPLLPCI